MAKESRLRWIAEIAAASVIGALAVRAMDKYFSKKTEQQALPAEPQQNPAMVAGQQPTQQFLVAPPVPPPVPMPVPFPVYTQAPQMMQPQQPNFPQVPQFPRLNPEEEEPELEEVVEEIDPVDEIEREWEENGWDA